ncbi:MAG: hypothetical protein ACLFWL_05205 [Candidatus Brocadiia bacterium]
MVAAIIGTIIAVILGVVAIIVYIVGARPQKPWGTPVMAICVIGAVAAVFAQQFDLFEKAGRRRGPRYMELQKMGEGFKGQLSEGARVIIFRTPYEMMEPGMMPPPEEMPEGTSSEEYRKEMEDMRAQMEEQKVKQTKEMEKAFEKGLGADIELVACTAPKVKGAKPGMEMADAAGPMGNFPAPAFSRVLDKYKDQGLDAWISTIGLPRAMDEEFSPQLQYVSSFKWSNPPAVGVHVGMAYNPAEIKGYMGHDKLDVAVLQDMKGEGKNVERIWKVITKDTLSELPAEPSEQYKSMMGTGAP